ncbi:hypothetical protein BV158_00491B, partial [Haemophilus influenzae]
RSKSTRKWGMAY